MFYLCQNRKSCSLILLVLFSVLLLIDGKRLVHQVMNNKEYLQVRSKMFVFCFYSITFDALLFSVVIFFGVIGFGMCFCCIQCCKKICPDGFSFFRDHNLDEVTWTNLHEIRATVDHRAVGIEV